MGIALKKPHLGALRDPHRLRVNSLGPAFLLTPMTAPLFAQEFRAKTLARIPFGRRRGEAEDLLGAILLRASDASALMTGSALTLDGGWTAV